MTPRELAAVVKAVWPQGAEPLRRAGLEELMGRFPDGV